MSKQFVILDEQDERETTMAYTILNTSNRQPAITGTLNQTTESDLKASTFATKEEAKSTIDWLCAEEGFTPVELTIVPAKKCFDVTGNNGELEVGTFEADSEEEALDKAGKVLGHKNHAGVIAFGREHHNADWTLTAKRVD